MIKVNVKGAEKAKRSIRRAIEKMQAKKSIVVGLPEGSGVHSDDGINNATLGAILHFGNDNIPARPWLDTGVKSGEHQYLELAKQGFKKKEDPELTLNRIGATAAAAVQVFMVELSDPPNDPKTIKAKGSSNPLIDTGILRSSIAYKLIDSEPTEGIT